MSLTGKQRRHLRALAHDLAPVVQIGRGGASDAVLRQIDGALVDHELIKVKVAREAPASAKEVGEQVKAGLKAEVAQVIGRIVVVYRAHPKEPKIFPSPAQVKAAAKAAALKVASSKKDAPRRAPARETVRKKTASKWASKKAPAKKPGTRRKPPGV